MFINGFFILFNKKLNIKKAIKYDAYFLVVILYILNGRL